MSGAISRYSVVIYMISAVVLSVSIILIYYAVFSIEPGKGIINIALVSLGILFGIWAQSNIVRYVGAIRFAALAGGAIVGLYSAKKIVWSLPFVWAIAVSGLSLSICGIMLLSRRFTREFIYLRETQSKYKRNLIKVGFTVLIVAAVIATIIDIIQLRNS